MYTDRHTQTDIHTLINNEQPNSSALTWLKFFLKSTCANEHSSNGCLLNSNLMKMKGQKYMLTCII